MCKGRSVPRPHTWRAPLLISGITRFVFSIYSASSQRHAKSELYWRGARWFGVRFAPSVALVRRCGSPLALHGLRACSSLFWVLVVLGILRYFDVYAVLGPLWSLVFRSLTWRAPALFAVC